ncbi:hypothetical protein N0V95_009181 [Ascochyta clinopodiicola]|nr:hypothetical protein N0V95_009181 [Ascochyta clinopodiicola]
MFDKIAHPRDYVDSNVVIARAGGGQAKDKNSGEMRATRDQIEDTTSNSLRNCMNHYNPVVIITGVDNPHMPSQPPYQYCVLDYFKPTHIWTEKSGTSKIVRYRFEKLNRLAVSLREPLWPLTYSYTPSRDTHSPLVAVNVSFAHNYRINRYTIPGIDGFITHMVANRAIVEEPNGPDSMYEELQQTDIGLRRRPIDNSQLKGGTYTRNFLVNYGMPYKFIAATASHPFTSAARPITATRSRLNWAAKYLLSHGRSGSPHPAISTSNSSQASHSSTQVREFENHEFNEVLALGYFESQKISYHDDGEFGLSPTIATLSLGAPGTMRIRLKAKHHLGVSTAGVYTDALPLPGCNNYTSRLAAHDDLQALKSSDPKSYRKRLKELPKEMNLKTSGNAKDVLKMEVAHGDVVVMHGAQLQKYYEHAVEHSGKLRFALTCRYIDPESLGEGEKPEYEVERDQGGYDGAVLEGRGGGSVMDHTLT